MALKNIFKWMIRIYRRWVSPFFPPMCRFFPTCSDYAIQSIDKYGIMRGCFLSLKRISRCHPFHSGGYDPVP